MSKKPETEAFSCLAPFFEAVNVDASNMVQPTRYFLGYRLKDPGGDLVLFRHDGVQDDGSPRGGAFIFHYAGYNRGQGGDIPQLSPMHNIRNTFLFEVTPQEYKKTEDKIDLLRTQGVANPYYFSRPLSVAEMFETKGRVPTDYQGVPKEQFGADYINPELYPSGDKRGNIPMVATNCVYLATQIMAVNAGIDLNAIYDGLGDIERGADLAIHMDAIKDSFVRGDFKTRSGRACLCFDEEGKKISLPVLSGAPLPAQTAIKPF